MQLQLLLPMELLTLHKVYKYSYILLYLLQIYESSYIMSVQVITILPESGPSIIVLSESGP